MKIRSWYSPCQKLQTAIKSLMWSGYQACVFMYKYVHVTHELSGAFLSFPQAYAHTIVDTWRTLIFHIVELPLINTHWNTEEHLFGTTHLQYITTNNIYIIVVQKTSKSHSLAKLCGTHCNASQLVYMHFCESVFYHYLVLTLWSMIIVIYKWWYLHKPYLAFNLSSPPPVFFK